MPTYELFGPNGQVVESFEQDPTPIDLSAALTALFVQGKDQLSDSVPDAVRGQLYILQAGVLGALRANDPEAAKALIVNAELPPLPEMEAIRQAMIDLFDS
jgi:hypothetical protein